MTAFGRRLFDVVQPASHSSAGSAFRTLHHLILAGGLCAVIAETMPPFASIEDSMIEAVIGAATLFFAAEYLLRLAVAPFSPSAPPEPAWHLRRRWMASPLGLIDLGSALLLPAGLLLGLPAEGAHLLAVLWVLKLFRYSSGTALLSRVIRQAWPPLSSVFVAFLAVLLLAGTLMYVLESPGQPQSFGSIPNALWWTIVTLTTTGYGDEVPATPGGRLLASLVMICGIAVFALWAGILANAFANEVRRRDFLRTWDMVTKVPFLHDLGAEVIADISRLLHPRDLDAGQVVFRRGDPGECMFFIVSGEIEIEIQPQALRMGHGAFFGEFALLTGAPRSATAVARRDSLLMVLDIADFRDIAARRPELASAVGEEAARRMGRATS